MPHEVLNLLFPQWQGAGVTGQHLQIGAMQLARAFSPDRLFEQLPVLPVPDSLSPCAIKYQDVLLSQAKMAMQWLNVRNPSRLFMVGGDCSTELAPVSFMHRKYGDSMAVIWLDAHGDMNIPEESPTGHFHGMVLRSLLGEGDPAWVAFANPALGPSQVILVGSRALDPAEAVYCEERQISTFPPQSSSETLEFLVDTLKERGFSRIYIHVDCDVMDPKTFPHVGCPTPGGWRPASIHAILSGLARQFECVGLGMTEYTGADVRQSQTLRMLCEAVLETMEMPEAVRLNA